jgi:hypothetical protein
MLSIRDVLTLKLEFPGVFAELFEDVETRLRKELLLKLEVIRTGELANANSQIDGQERLKSMVTSSHVMGGLW